jgi:hypothetical protein
MHWSPSAMCTLVGALGLLGAILLPILQRQSHFGHGLEEAVVTTPAAQPSV